MPAPVCTAVLPQLAAAARSRGRPAPSVVCTQQPAQGHSQAGFRTQRSQEAEERISEVEDRLVEITDAGQKREKRLKTNEERLRELWDNVKHTNIHIIGVPEGEEREKGQKKYSTR